MRFFRCGPVPAHFFLANALTCGIVPTALLLKIPLEDIGPLDTLLTLTAYSELLLAVPLAGAVLMLIVPSAVVRYAVLLLVAIAHCICSAALVAYFAAPTAPAFAPVALFGIVQPDATGTLFLALASVLFLSASVYAVGYLRTESAHESTQAGIRRDFQDGTAFTNAPEQRFLSCLCLFLAAMSLVTTTQHMGALWVGIECTTLASAPLIYFHRHRRSLEATWKYLIICSVGIAMALLGNMLFTMALYPMSVDPALAGADQVGFFTRLAAKTLAENAVPTAWLKAAFVFLLVGYGTKMGLAPLHNWLPDAHSQAPSMVSALLSGALLNCAFLGIIRGHQVMIAAGLASFSGGLLLFFGLVSLLMASIFIVGQGQYKRLLAYSSVEHMGILAIGAGLGAAGAFAAMLHSVGHSLTKCMLFLLAGNILHQYRTHSSYDVHGMRWVMPVTAALWMAGFLALAGLPPFALFVTELSLLMALVQSKSYLASAIYLISLAIIFVGMSVPILRMVQGARPPAMPKAYTETVWNIGPALGLGLMVLMLGLWLPDWLTRFLRAAAAVLAGGGHGL